MTSWILKIMALAAALLAPVAFAQDGAAAESGVALSGIALSKGLAIIGAGFAGLGAAIGVGLITGRMLEALARQPELKSQLQPFFFLGAGLADAVPIIVIVLAMLTVFG